MHTSPRSLSWMVSLVVFLLLSGARAQEQSATYVSQIDEDLTIRRVAAFPVSDNVDGIYARPAETQLIQLIRNSHRWDYVDSNIAGAIPSLIELEESPTQVQKLLTDVEADAVIAAALSKGPTGLSIRVDLFLKKDGKLLAQEVVRDLPRFEIPEIRNQITLLYAKILARIPYEGLVLSRQLNRVTINLGKSDGLVKDQTVTAVQILSATRHPKFNFLVSSEKEILGRIKILKVDETLSFGAIVAEKEKGAIRRLAKISGLNQVNYGEPANLSEGSSASDLATRPDSNVSFGKSPREWLPVQPPSFGAVGAKLGFGSFSSTANLSSGSLEAKSSFYPSMSLFGEMWITPEWTIRADITQGIVSTSNPRSGSQPSEINHLISRYSLEAGYNFLLRDDFFGPKLSLSAGFMNYKVAVDDSTPTGLTTVNYSGLLIGLGGSFPVTEEKEWFAGGRLNLYLLNTLSESPKSSGSESKNNINDFTLFVERKIAENLRLTGSLDFALYNSSLSGQGTRANGETATTLSQKHTILAGGITYMF